MQCNSGARIDFKQQRYLVFQTEAGRENVNKVIAADAFPVSQCILLQTVMVTLPFRSSVSSSWAAFTFTAFDVQWFPFLLCGHLLPEAFLQHSGESMRGIAQKSKALCCLLWKIQSCAALLPGTPPVSPQGQERWLHGVIWLGKR